MKRPSVDFEVMVRAHSRELYSYAYGLCRDRHTAEDLVQEVFLRAWRHLDGLREPAALRSWLYTILQREHARQYRASKPEFDEFDEMRLPLREDPAESDDLLLLRQAVHCLPLTYREPLLLQVHGGFSCNEIAGLLGISQANVMARVSRARKKLRAYLREGEDPTIAMVKDR